MLWTDSLFVSAADLDSIDPDVVATADAEGIDFPTIIQRGLEDAGRYLETKLISFSTYISSNDLSASHLAAVFYTGSQPNQRRRVSLEQIVITGRNASWWSELQQWAVNRVLMTFYQAASNRAEGDRYEAKLDQFRVRDVREQWPLLKKSGAPIVYRPMPAPDAVQARNPGSWSTNLVMAGGATLNGVSVDVAVSYVDSQYYLSQMNSGNRESNPSGRKTQAMTTGNALSVDITSLNPPNSSVLPDMLGRGFVVPGDATGWNLWVGQAGQTMFLQNPAPIPIAMKVFSLSSDPIFSGFAAGIGQFPDAFLTIPDLISRA